MSPQRARGRARRRLTAVDELERVGGSPCLDLVNTTGARTSGSPRERLNDYEDLVAWSRRVGLLSPEEARALAERASSERPRAERALARVRAAREGLYRLLRAAAEGRALPEDEIARLNRLWQAARRRSILTPSQRGLILGSESPAHELDRMLWPLVDSAVELLTSPEDLARLKRCAECDWLFLDTSKNGSRRWCKNLCGDRVRARRHYRRQREDDAS